MNEVEFGKKPAIAVSVRYGMEYIIEIDIPETGDFLLERGISESKNS
jgi:hypothetical protein